MSIECMFTMQCLERCEKKLASSLKYQNGDDFATIYRNLRREIHDKEEKTEAEKNFLDYQLDDVFRLKNRNIDVSFFTIFTELFPEISFRLYYFYNDLCAGQTFIFDGSEYREEYRLVDHYDSDYGMVKIGEYSFICKKMEKFYSMENFTIPLNIMDIRYREIDEEKHPGIVYINEIGDYNISAQKIQQA